MPLTREFTQTIVELCKGAEYRKELLCEVLETYISGEFDVAYGSFKNYLNATGSFPEIASKMGLKESSLRRMLGKGGNPTGRNFAKAFSLAFEQEKLTPTITAHSHAA